MKTEEEMTTTLVATDHKIEAEQLPSAEFVRAVSDFLDTDPADLLAEMGYYDRSNTSEAAAADPKN